MAENFERATAAFIIRAGKKNEEQWSWVLEILSEYQLIVDSYEQVRERPGGAREQENYYSGKQKRHTFKNQILVTPNGGEIVDIVVGEPGKSSDINLWRCRQKQFNSRQKFQGDKAYVGEAAIKSPHKKKRNRVLSSSQKRDNKKQAQTRIYVEHLIRLIKIFKVAQERFRLKASNYKLVMQVVCGLVRWRIGTIVFNS